MKKNSIILLICALFSFSAFAQNTMKDRTQNWTQESPATTGGGSIGGDIGGGTTPSTPGTPVGDTAWALVLGLGAAYGAYVLTRKRKEA